MRQATNCRLLQGLKHQIDEYFFEVLQFRRIFPTCDLILHFILPIAPPGFKFRVRLPGKERKKFRKTKKQVPVSTCFFLKFTVGAAKAMTGR